MKLGTEHLSGATIYVLAHPCPMCLGSLYYCSPDQVVFLTQCDQYDAYQVHGDANYIEIDREHAAALLSDALKTATNTTEHRVDCARLALETAAH